MKRHCAWRLWTTRTWRAACCARTLAGLAGIDVVAECDNGFEAVKAVAELAPDLLLLDVQMPKLNGFEVLELVGRDVAVIFTTAHDEYGLQRLRRARGRLPD